VDVVFFLKAFAGPAVQELPWPGDVRLIGLEPPLGVCGGTDPRCSSAYSALWQAWGGRDGRFIETALAKHGVEAAERVAFVGFSASHGLLNPLCLREGERIDALLLADASFGGGKDGYVDYVIRAARGERLFATITGDTGGDESFMAVWDRAADELGEAPEVAEVRGGLPDPAGGSWRLGELAYAIRYVPGQPGTKHWEMGGLLPAFVDGYLVDYWAGGLGRPWPWLEIGLYGSIAAVFGWAMARR
jgi:hypothetical protein